MSTSTNTSGGSVGGLSLVIGVVFVVFKLTHVIDWSWWWVTAPFWAPLTLVLGLSAIVALFGGATLLVGHLWDQRR